MISGYQIVVFLLFFRGIFAESRTVVRTVCGQFCGRSFAPGVSFVSVCSNSECETQRLPEFDMPWMSSFLQWIYLNLGLGASMEASSKLQKRQTSAQPCARGFE